MIQASNEIIQGNALEVTRTFLDNSINCIVTSPPYFGLRDYGLPPTDWPAVSYAPMAGLPEISVPAMSCCLGLEDTIEAYVGHMVLIFRGLWRVLRGDGVAWLNLGDSYASNKATQCNPSGNTGQAALSNGLKRPPISESLKPKDLMAIPWRVALALQADGWYLRSDVIWHKKNCLPESVRDRPTKGHEYIFLLAKEGRYWYDQEAIREPQVTQSQGEAISRAGKGGAQYDKWEDRNGFRGLGGLHRGKKSYNPSGRNTRTVWSIATAPFKEAHFAVFPPALAERCILAACPSRVCVECGEPWVRVVEKETKLDPGRNTIGLGPKTLDNPMTSNGHGGSILHHNVSVKTLGFTPSCQCCPLPAHKKAYRPGIVLDPFFGSGTTGVVSEQLGRHWLGIDLNPEYAEMAKKRIQAVQPALFAL